MSVVIPAIKYNLELEKCLESLISQKNIQLEVFVVFNPEIPKFDISKWPNWVHFVQSSKGVNCARNIGLMKSSHDLVYFLDTDCELLSPDHLEKIIQYIIGFPNLTGVGGGYQIPRTEDPVTQAYHFIQMEWLGKQILNSEGLARALIGGNMLLRKSKLLDQQFDEKIIFGGTEEEFFVRLYQLGAQFHLNFNFNVLHHSFLTEKEFFRKAKSQAEGEKYIYRKTNYKPRESSQYLVRTEVNASAWYYIEKYRGLFKKSEWISFKFKKFFYKLSEHFRVAQSSSERNFW